jgi:hypothetical protein
VRLRSVLSIAAACALLPASAPAVRLLGVSFADGLLYDVDAATGAASNPRSVLVPDPECPGAGCILDHPSGLEILPDGSLLLAPVATANVLKSHLVHTGGLGNGSVVPSSVALGVEIGEGDLALDPQTGALYAFGLTNLAIPFLLLRIEPGADGWADPTTTVVGELQTGDVSAMAFAADGTLYAIDTDADALVTLDPTDASTLASVDLSEPLGPLAGMDFDATGTLWVADGGADGQAALFTLDPASGALHEIGPLGLANGLSGLAVPEPDARIAGAIAFAALARRRTRRLS